MDLPRYSRECKRKPNGDKITKRDLKAIGFLKQNSSGFQLLFEQLPGAYELKEDYASELPTYIRNVKEEHDSLLGDLKHQLIWKTKALFSIAPLNAEARTSLAGIIGDWIETLDKKIREQLFPDGTHKLLELFSSVPNDEEMFIARLAKMVTDLRMEDWDDTTLESCLKRLKQYKETAETFHSQTPKEPEELADGAGGYKVTFPTSDGRTVTKRFAQVQYGNRGKLLYNQITSALASMGQALSEQEKRQIMMEILEKLC